MAMERLHGSRTMPVAGARPSELEASKTHGINAGSWVHWPMSFPRVHHFTGREVEVTKYQVVALIASYVPTTVDGRRLLY